MPGLLVNVDVPDLERAIAFYTQAFELRLSRRFTGGSAELLGADAPIYLLENPPGSSAVASTGAHRDYARHWTPVHLDFTVADLDPALARALAAGAKLERGPQTHPYGRIAVLADPFGHGIDLLQLSPRGYDAIAIG